MSRYLLLSHRSDLAHKIGQAADGGAADVRMLAPEGAADSLAAVLSTATARDTEVLLLGPDVPLDDCLRLAEVIEARRPDITVVWIASSTAEMAVAGMRAGIRDILDPDADEASIRSLLERATAATRRKLPKPANDDGGGQVIAVMSPKGGVGKTTVATNLAVGLAKRAPMSVVVVDLDLQFGDVASGLALKPEHSVLSAVQDTASVDAMMLKAFLTVHPSGVYALSAPASPADAERISGAQVARLLERLAAEFSYVVVDTAPGLGEHCLAVLEQATDVVWVCGMDIPSIRGLQASFAVLTELDLLPDNRHVVLNFADRRSGLRIADVEATIGTSIDVVVPHSRSVPFSTNQGSPLLQSGRRDPVSRALRKLVERFYQTHSGLPEQQPQHEVVA